MPPSPKQQPIRYAIQKARGKGWKTLEVGEELAQAEARFNLMVKVNPRAYFRLIQLDYNPDSTYEGMEFNWTLIQLYDPTKKGISGPARAKPAKRGRRGREKVRLPLRFYVTVIVLGALVGLLAYWRYGMAP
ncbi:hypothetical protein [Azospirillum sp.]|uniref:hypothetical protein n=1 Tax=Azospirillum sp. TaxID=34012 RepID=UPI002D6244B5|nr:hypothetical protein [Azospirillum sp.]HYD70066.1 hypothetical protein [Azospirillum sp.]